MSSKLEPLLNQTLTSVIWTTVMTYTSIYRVVCSVASLTIKACTVPVPSDQDGHDHAPVAQNGEENDDGKVHDPALLAFLHAGARSMQDCPRDEVY